MTNLPELHDDVHEAVGDRHGQRRRLEEIVDGDLVLDGLVQELLTSGQRAADLDFDLDVKSWQCR